MQKATLARTDSMDSAWMTVEQAQKHYQFSRKGVIELAERAGGLAVFGRRQRIYRPLCDEYLLNTVRFNDGTETD